VTPVRKSIQKNNLRCWLVTVSMNNKLTKNQSHNARNYLGSDLLSFGVLRPVPEQQLRFSLTRVQSPYGHYNTSSAGLPSQSKRTTPWIPPGLPSQPKGTTSWIPPGLPSHTKGNTTKRIE
ncbi:hypothetical protein Taro_040627, partial [Colocasia esculenta]|nr:hypothetical protein [Colocasia esculenta]